MIARRLLFAFSMLALLAAPSVAQADEDWHHDNGWHGHHGHHWDRDDRDERRWSHEEGYRESSYNRDPHAYWSPHRRCWVHESNYYWDTSEYHWVPGPAGNFILIRLNL
jgi:hypothetical protein